VGTITYWPRHKRAIQPIVCAKQLVNKLLPQSNNRGSFFFKKVSF